MSNYLLVLELKKLLGSLNACLDKAESHAADKKYDPEVLLHCRLAPDMFPLWKQVQSVCDQAKYVAGRTTGKDMPTFAEGTPTLQELRQQISQVVRYLDAFGPTDFENIAERVVTTPRWNGKSMTAANYFVEHAVPNFFFHLSMAYAILRNNGVDVGKKDYLGTLSYC